MGSEMKMGCVATSGWGYKHGTQLGSSAAPKAVDAPLPTEAAHPRHPTPRENTSVMPPGQPQRINPAEPWRTQRLIGCVVLPGRRGRSRADGWCVFVSWAKGGMLLGCCWTAVEPQVVRYWTGVGLSWADIG